MRAKADFDALVERAMAVGGYGHGPAFRETMTRFIPADVHERTFGRAGFDRYLIGQTDRLLADTARQIGAASAREDFHI